MTAVRVAALVNPADAANTEITLRDVEAAARTLGLHVQVLKADTGDEINAAFENIVRERPDALFVAATAFFVSRRVQLTQLAALHRLPAAYPLRNFAEVGGLMSYEVSAADAYRQVGIYTGRILKGAKPACPRSREVLEGKRTSRGHWNAEAHETRKRYYGELKVPSLP